jgi:hypothetical protein
MAVLIPKKNTRSVQSNERADKEATIQRFRERKSWFMAEQMRQRANRYQMMLDEAYYDGEHYLPHERAAIEARGQAPVVHNECKSLTDFMIGTERRSRVDFSITHRTENSEQAQAEARAKTQLLKYLDDINRTPFERSEAADDCFKAGLGWLEVGARADPSQPAIYVRNVSWKEILHDSLGQQKMPDDWRYIFRFKELDFDIAEALFPGKADLLEKAAINADTRQYMSWVNGDPAHGGVSALQDFGIDVLNDRYTFYDADAWLSNPRRRVLIIECWSNEPYKAPRRPGVALGDDEPVIMRKRVTLMTEHDTLLESWSPYNHGKYPFIPHWCYRRKKDGQPYGMIRQQRSPQDQLNRHMSKAVYRLSTKQIHYEEGALSPEIMDADELADRLADPSAAIEWAKGAVSGKKYEIVEGAALVAPEVQMAEAMRQTIRASSGVPTENRGQDPDSVSGIARKLRRDQGALMTAEPFDNLLLARQLEGELVLSLSEQYITNPMTFSTRGNARAWDYTDINKPGPDGQIQNDITRIRGQFVIGEAPWAQDLAESAFESMMTMLGELAKVSPQVVISILDVVLDLHPNLPKKGVILQRIRQVSGQADPDEPMTPERQKQMQQQQMLAQAQFEAQLSGLRAEVAEAKAKGDKLTAEAVSTRLEALYMAAQAAQVLTLAPAIAPVADVLTKAAGFKEEDGDAPLDGSVPIQPPQPQNGGQGGAAMPLPELQQTDGALQGAQTGIESPEVTGLQGA